MGKIRSIADLQKGAEENWNPSYGSIFLADTGRTVDENLGDTYKKYNISTLNMTEDMMRDQANDLISDKQSSFDKFYNTGAKMILNSINEYRGGMSYVPSIITNINPETFSNQGILKGFNEMLFDNEDSQAADLRRQEISRDYQNFYKDNQYLAPFMDSLLGDAFPFVIGAAATEATIGLGSALLAPETGGASAVAGGAAMVATAMRTGKNIMKAVSTAKNILKGADYGMDIARATNILASGAKAAASTKNLLRIGRQALTSAGYESSIQAYGMMEQGKERLNKLKEAGEISEEDYKAAMEDLSASALGVYAVNIATLSASNALQFDQFAMGKSGVASMFKRAAGESVEEALVRGIKSKTLTTGIGKGLLNGSIEAGEEFGQGIFDNIGLDYALAKYDPEYASYNKSFISSTVRGVSDSFNMQLGEEALSGFVLGIMGMPNVSNMYKKGRQSFDKNSKPEDKINWSDLWDGGVAGAIKDNKEEKKTLENYLNEYKETKNDKVLKAIVGSTNEELKSNLFDGMFNVKLHEAAIDSAQNNDMVSTHTQNHVLFHNFVRNRMELGQEKDIDDMIESLEKSPIDELKKEYPDMTEDFRKKRVSELKELVASTKTAIKTAKELNPNKDLQKALGLNLSLQNNLLSRVKTMFNEVTGETLKNLDSKTIFDTFANKKENEKRAKLESENKDLQTRIEQYQNEISNLQEEYENTIAQFDKQISELNVDTTEEDRIIDSNDKILNSESIKNSRANRIYTPERRDALQAQIEQLTEDKNKKIQELENKKRELEKQKSEIRIDPDKKQLKESGIKKAETTIDFNNKSLDTLEKSVLERVNATGISLEEAVKDNFKTINASIANTRSKIVNPAELNKFDQKVNDLVTLSKGHATLVAEFNDINRNSQKYMKKIEDVKKEASKEQVRTKDNVYVGKETNDGIITEVVVNPDGSIEKYITDKGKEIKPEDLKFTKPEDTLEKALFDEIKEYGKHINTSDPKHLEQKIEALLKGEIKQKALDDLNEAIEIRKLNSELFSEFVHSLKRISRKINTSFFERNTKMKERVVEVLSKGLSKNEGEAVTVKFDEGYTNLSDSTNIYEVITEEITTSSNRFIGSDKHSFNGSGIYYTPGVKIKLKVVYEIVNGEVLVKGIIEDFSSMRIVLTNGVEVNIYDEKSENYRVFSQDFVKLLIELEGNTVEGKEVVANILKSIDTHNVEKKGAVSSLEGNFDSSPIFTLDDLRSPLSKEIVMNNKGSLIVMQSKEEKDKQEYYTILEDGSFEQLDNNHEYVKKFQSSKTESFNKGLDYNNGNFFYDAKNNTVTYLKFSGKTKDSYGFEVDENDLKIADEVIFNNVEVTKPLTIVDFSSGDSKSFGIEGALSFGNESNKSESISIASDRGVGIKLQFIGTILGVNVDGTGLVNSGHSGIDLKNPLVQGYMDSLNAFSLKPNEAILEILNSDSSDNNSKSIKSIMNYFVKKENGEKYTQSEVNKVKEYISKTSNNIYKSSMIYNMMLIDILTNSIPDKTEAIKKIVLNANNRKISLMLSKKRPSYLSYNAFTVDNSDNGTKLRNSFEKNKVCTTGATFRYRIKVENLTPPINTYKGLIESYTTTKTAEEKKKDSSNQKSSTGNKQETKQKTSNDKPIFNLTDDDVFSFNDLLDYFEVVNRGDSIANQAVVSFLKTKFDIVIGQNGMKFENKLRGKSSLTKSDKKGIKVVLLKEFKEMLKEQKPDTFEKLYGVRSNTSSEKSEDPFGETSSDNGREAEDLFENDDNLGEQEDPFGETESNEVSDDSFEKTSNVEDLLKKEEERQKEEAEKVKKEQPKSETDSKSKKENKRSFEPEDLELINNIYDKYEEGEDLSDAEKTKLKDFYNNYDFTNYEILKVELSNIPGVAGATKLTEESNFETVDFKTAKENLKKIAPDWVKINELSEEFILSLAVNLGVEPSRIQGFFDGVIRLRSKGLKGTEFHEFFHVVFNMIINDDLKSKLLLEASMRYPKPSAEQIVKLMTMFKLNKKEATERYYEEHMADDFMNKSSNFKPKSFIQKVLDFIKRLFSKKSNIDDLMIAILKGNFKNAPMRYYNKTGKAMLLEVNTVLRDETVLKDLLPYQDAYNVINSIAFYMLENIENNVEISFAQNFEESLSKVRDSYNRRKEPMKSKLETLEKEEKNRIELRFSKIVSALLKPENKEIIKREVSEKMKLFNLDLSETDLDIQEDEGKNSEWAKSILEMGGGLDNTWRRLLAFTMYDAPVEEDSNTGKRSSLQIRIPVNVSQVNNHMELLCQNVKKEEILNTLLAFKYEDSYEDDGEIRYENPQVVAVIDSLVKRIQKEINENAGEILDVNHENAWEYSSTYATLTNQLYKTNSNPIDIILDENENEGNSVMLSNSNAPRYKSVRDWKDRWENIKADLKDKTDKSLLLNVKTVWEKNSMGVIRDNNIRNIMVALSRVGIKVSKKYIRESIKFYKESMLTLDKLQDLGIIMKIDNGIFTLTKEDSEKPEVIKFFEDYGISVLGFTIKFVIDGDFVRPSLKNNIPIDKNFKKGIYSKFINNITESKSEFDKMYDTKGKLGYNKDLGSVAEENALYDETVRKTTYKNFENKTQYETIFNMYLKEKEKILKDPTAFENMFKQDLTKENKEEILKGFCKFMDIPYNEKDIKLLEEMFTFLKTSPLYTQGWYKSIISEDFSISFLGSLRRRQSGVNKKEKVGSRKKGFGFGDLNLSESLRAAFVAYQEKEYVRPIHLSGKSTQFVFSSSGKIVTNLEDNAIGKQYTSIIEHELKRIVRSKANNISEKDVEGYKKRSITLSQNEGFKNHLSKSDEGKEVLKSIESLKSEDDIKNLLIVESFKNQIEGYLKVEYKQFEENFAKENTSFYVGKKQYVKVTKSGKNSKKTFTNNSDELNDLKRFFYDSWFKAEMFYQIMENDKAISLKSIADVIKRSGGLIASGTGSLGELKANTLNDSVLEHIIGGNTESVNDLDLIKRDAKFYWENSIPSDYTRSFEDDFNGKVMAYLPPTLFKEVERYDGDSFATVETLVNHILKPQGKMTKKVKEIYNKVKLGIPLSFEEYNYLKDNNALNQKRKMSHFNFLDYMKTSTQFIGVEEFAFLNDKGLNAVEEGRFSEMEELYNTNKQAYLDKYFKIRLGKENMKTVWLNMQNGKVDIVFFKSASKQKKSRVIGKEDDSLESQLSQISEDNAIILDGKYFREQMKTDGVKQKVPHGTQEEQLIWSEQSENMNADSKKYSELLASRIEYVKESLKEEIGYDSKTGEVNFENKVLRDAFLENILENNGSLFLYEFVKDIDWNVPYTNEKIQNMFFSYMSKPLSHKRAGSALALQSDVLTQVIRVKSDITFKDGTKVFKDQVLTTDFCEKYHDELLGEKDSWYVSRLMHNRYDPETKSFYGEAVIPKIHKSLQEDSLLAVPKAFENMFKIRIPTQDKHSMMYIKIVDTMPAYKAATIVLPLETVYLAGEDFDIDKAYVYWNEVYKNSKGEYVKYGDYKTTDQLHEDIFKIALSNLEDETSEEFKSLKSELRETLLYIKQLNKDLKDWKYNQEDGSVFLDIYLLKKSYENKRDVIEKLEDFKKVLISDWIEVNKDIYSKMEKRMSANSNNNFDKQPSNKYEYNNDLLLLEQKLVHNIDNKEIALTPASMDAVKDLIYDDLKIEYRVMGVNSLVGRMIGINASEELVNNTIKKIIKDKLYAYNEGVHNPNNVASAQYLEAVGEDNIGVGAKFNTLAQYYFKSLNKSDSKVKDFIKRVVKVKNGEYMFGDLFRINDTNSAIISSSTDNSKEQHAGYLGLDITTLPMMQSSMLMGLNPLNFKLFMKHGEAFIADIRDGDYENKYEKSDTKEEDFFNHENAISTLLTEITNNYSEEKAFDLIRNLKAYSKLDDSTIKNIISDIITSKNPIDKVKSNINSLNIMLTLALNGTPNEITKNIVLESMKKIKRFTNFNRELSSITNLAKGLEINSGDLRQLVRSVANVINNEEFGDLAKEILEDPFLKNSVNDAIETLKIASNYFLQATQYFSNIENFVSNFTNGKVLQEANYLKFRSGLTSYLFSKIVAKDTTTFNSKLFNSIVENKGTFFTKMDKYYREHYGDSILMRALTTSELKLEAKSEIEYKVYEASTWIDSSKQATEMVQTESKSWDVLSRDKKFNEAFVNQMYDDFNNDVDKFHETYDDYEKKAFFMKYLFNQCFFKDSLQFKSGSLATILNPSMFKNNFDQLIKAIKDVDKDSVKSNDTVKALTGKNMVELQTEFLAIYLDSFDVDNMLEDGRNLPKAVESTNTKSITEEVEDEDGVKRKVTYAQYIDISLNTAAPSFKQLMSMLRLENSKSGDAYFVGRETQINDLNKKVKEELGKSYTKIKNEKGKFLTVMNLPLAYKKGTYRYFINSGVAHIKRKDGTFEKITFKNFKELSENIKAPELNVKNMSELDGIKNLQDFEIYFEKARYIRVTVLNSPKMQPYALWLHSDKSKVIDSVLNSKIEPSTEDVDNVEISEEQSNRLEEISAKESSKVVEKQSLSTAVRNKLSDTMNMLNLMENSKLLEMLSDNISSKGSELGKKLTNVGNNLKIDYKGKSFRNAEHAYQTWKSGEFDQVAFDSTDYKPKGSKVANKESNYQTMVDILVEKFKQHPFLIEEINANGGLLYLQNSKHNVNGDKYWESSGENMFMKALIEAYKNITIESMIKEGVLQYTNHSGGAEGSDIQWDKIGKEFGFVNNKHYWTETKTPHGNTEITKKDFEEGRYESAKAAKRNFGYQYDAMKDSRLIRNWSQVKHSDAIFAIGKIIDTGEKIFPNQKSDTRVAQTPSVTGGTGYAVAMGINHNKPVYVFNQSKSNKYDTGWYKWDNNSNDFVKTETPVLTKNFAGIGTREINDIGKQAIRDVYQKTINQSLREAAEIQSVKNMSIEEILGLEKFKSCRQINKQGG